MGTPGNPRRLNYVKFLAELGRRFGKPGQPAEFPYRFYYTAYRDALDLKRREEFLASIERQGFTVSAVRAKAYSDGTTADKGVDIALAIDAYRTSMVGDIKLLVVGTHDSDFASLFERVSPEIRKVVVGWRSRMGRELHEVAEPLYFDDIWPRVDYGNSMGFRPPAPQNPSPVGPVKKPG